MELIKRTILLEDSIDRANYSQTYGQITATSFYVNVMLTQNLVTEIDIYAHLSKSDYYTTTTTTHIAGQPKPANTIPVMLVLSNPLTDRIGYFEGYHLYDYKDEFIISNPPKS